VPLVYKTLYTDYESLEIAHRCAKPYGKTGVCDEPKFFINTRKKPPTLTPSEEATIQTKVNQVLQPYCFSTKDLTFTIRDETRFKPCSPKLNPDFTALVNKLKATLGENV
jgi:hypothetical protein